MAKKSKTALTKAMAMTLCPTIKEIFRLDTDGWACGLTVCNEVFEGSIYDLAHAFFTYDSPKNREFVEYLWGGDSFAKEVTV